MRKLCSIEEVLDIKKAENSDNLELAIIKGWQVVVKKDEFKIGEKIIYFEIDALIPRTKITEFLFKDKKEDVQEARLKTIKLRGNLSQGLILSLNQIGEYYKEISGEVFDFNALEIGTDLTEQLKIRKYEPPVPEEAGAKSSSKVWEIPKTDEERYQSNPDLVDALKGKEYYASVKLDGTSTTIILNINDENEPEVNVCGRNTCYEENPNNKYWAVAMKYNMKEKILEYYNKTGKRLAFQGELIGPKIQGNKMGLTENDLYIFNVWIAEGKQPYEKCDIDTALSIVKELELKFVPIELTGIFEYNAEDLQGLTELPYNKYFKNAKPSQNIEGLVFRSKDMKVSFKVVSNKFLLRGGE